MRRRRPHRRGRALKRRYGPVGLRYVIEPSRSGNGHTIAAYTNSGTRMPLAWYPTYDAAVKEGLTGMLAEIKARRGEGDADRV